MTFVKLDISKYKMAESDPCNICGKLVNRKNILRHLDSHGPKKFRCDICDKRFATKDYLLQHERTHQKPQDIQCHLCSSEFTEKSSLKTSHLVANEISQLDSEKPGCIWYNAQDKDQMAEYKEVCAKIINLSKQLSDLQDSRGKYKMSLMAKMQEKIPMVGPCESILNESLSKLKMSQERHFGGDSMVGNRLHKGYVSIRAKDYTLTECFKDYPEIRKKMNDLWENVSTADWYFSQRDLSDNELEKCAVVCEQWCIMFPQYFPKQNITRKMLEYSMVLPRFLREKKNLMNTLLRFEQEGEHLHQLLNSSERAAYNSVFNKPYRYWLMLETYENKLYCTK